MLGLDAKTPGGVGIIGTYVRESVQEFRFR